MWRHVRAPTLCLDVWTFEASVSLDVAIKARKVFCRFHSDRFWHPGGLSFSGGNCSDSWQERPQCLWNKPPPHLLSDLLQLLLQGKQAESRRVFARRGPHGRACMQAVLPNENIYENYAEGSFFCTVATLALEFFVAMYFTTLTVNRSADELAGLAYWANVKWGSCGIKTTKWSKYIDLQA